MLDPASIVNVAPPPPPQLIGALAVAAETSGSIGIIIGVIVSIIIALVLALVFTHRRRYLNEKLCKNVGLQVPNGSTGKYRESTWKIPGENRESIGWLRLRLHAVTLGLGTPLGHGRPHESGEGRVHALRNCRPLPDGQGVDPARHHVPHVALDDNLWWAGARMQKVTSQGMRPA